MAAPLLPLILAGGAALVLLGGKKKKTTAAPREPEPEDHGDEEEVDEGAGPSPEPTDEEGPGYGIVASGVRRDKRGAFPWRIKYDAEGYHAQILISANRFSPVQEEVGVAASLKAAKGLLRDRFNELLLEKYPNEQAKNDPADVVVATVSGINLG